MPIEIHVFADIIDPVICNISYNFCLTFYTSVDTKIISNKFQIIYVHKYLAVIHKNALSIFLTTLLDFVYRFVHFCFPAFMLLALYSSRCSRSTFKIDRA